MPGVDAIIPAFNPQAGELLQAIGSCLAGREIGRVLVVDDGSEPAVELERSGRVVCLRQQNAGPSAARNLGLRTSDAEYVVFLDQDDWLEPGGLEAMLALAQRTGAVGVVAARYEHRAGHKRLKEAPEAWRDRVLERPGEIFRPLAIFGASGCLVRREPAAEVGFDEGLRIGEDRDFLRRLSERGPIAVCGTPAVNVQLHEGRGNLTSWHHLTRRIADHLLILERHHDRESDAPLREQTTWLLNAASKRRPVDSGSWRALTAAARARGWPIPLKARIRAWRRGPARA